MVVALDGAVWLGTDSGVSRFDGKAWTTYSTADGLGDKDVHASAVAPDGTVWFGTDAGVSRFDGKSWTAYATADHQASSEAGVIALRLTG